MEKIYSSITDALTRSMGKLQMDIEQINTKTKAGMEAITSTISQQNIGNTDFVKQLNELSQ
jgi:uncharacterized membrane protein